MRNNNVELERGSEWLLWEMVIEIDPLIFEMFKFGKFYFNANCWKI